MKVTIPNEAVDELRAKAWAGVVERNSTPKVKVPKTEKWFQARFAKFQKQFPQWVKFLESQLSKPARSDGKSRAFLSFFAWLALQDYARRKSQAKSGFLSGLPGPLGKIGHGLEELSQSDFGIAGAWLSASTFGLAGQALASGTTVAALGTERGKQQLGKTLQAYGAGAGLAAPLLPPLAAVSAALGAAGSALAGSVAQKAKKESDALLTQMRPDAPASSFFALFPPWVWALLAAASLLFVAVIL